MRDSYGGVSSASCGKGVNSFNTTPASGEAFVRSRRRSVRRTEVGVARVREEAVHVDVGVALKKLRELVAVGGVVVANVADNAAGDA